MIDIRAYLSTERVTVLKSRTKDGAIMELVALAAKSPAVEDAEKLEKRIREQSFDLSDFLEELKRVKNMGPLDELMKMIPGMSKAMEVRGLKGFGAMVTGMVGGSSGVPTGW